MKKVSVIVPVWGVEEYIDKCLNSLVNQTLEDIEIIVVNDESPDNSQLIIDNYVKQYPDKVKSFVKKNGGQGSARNFGLEKATGEYIGYVDSDDYIALDMYEKLYKKAKKEKADVVICDNFIDNNGVVIKEDIYRNLKYTDIQNAFFGKMAVWNKIYKRDIITKNDIKFKEKVWYEDLAFTLKILVNAKKVVYVDEPLYYYLIRKGSTMNNSNIVRNMEITLAFDDILSYINDNNKNDYMDIIEFLAINHIYISASVRVITAEADKKERYAVLKDLHVYFYERFSNFRNNKYLVTLSKNRKLIYNLMLGKRYFLIRILFKIKRR